MMNNEQIVEALKESGMRITRQRMIGYSEVNKALKPGGIFMIVNIAKK